MEKILYPGGRFNYSKTYTSGVNDPAGYLAEEGDLVYTYKNKYGIIKDMSKYPSIIIVEDNVDVTIHAADIHKLYKQ